MKRAKLPAKIPARFVPRFWVDADARHLAVKEIKRRYALLRVDAGADSYQQDLLVQRAVFLSVQLETAEVNAINGEPFDVSRYVGLTNALTGILKSLGLSRHAATLTWTVPTEPANGDGDDIPSDPE